jgi:Mn2+/Fe2+ NRAMP family transporter
MSTSKKSAQLGAAFLMATSAVGPGFLTQSTAFTIQLLANFGFVILVSVIIDLTVQLNIWQIVAASQKKAQQLARELLPGTDYLLISLIVLGGLAFNIGNVAGAGMGIETVTGCPTEVGAVGSAAIAITLFLVKEAGRALDAFAKWMGFGMILLILYVVYASSPPYAEAAMRTFVPTHFDSMATITLVGGTVGGYISFAGAHRLLDAGVSGVNALPAVRRSAITGIVVASTIRYLLFLATLGVMYMGLHPDPTNPAGSTFELAAGAVGKLLFGLVIWAASITSIVGAAYTSVSFLRGVHPAIEAHPNRVIIAFILFSTLVFLMVGRPVTILIWVGTLNGFVLPIALAILLLASGKRRIVGNYMHPNVLRIAGWAVVAMMAFLAVQVML